ncbi:MAG TPA: dihydroorotase [Steroidobacteraceae bacterium]|nr:dihydroorotase [Steroidobacteraceae bacterium]
MADTLTLRRPDDWHLHLRDGAELRSVLRFTAERFARAIVMPNLTPPVTTVAQAAAYRKRILEALGPGAKFEPLMTLYLTDVTPAREIEAARTSGFIGGVKLYPAGATTFSEAGVTRIEHCFEALESLQQSGLPLLVHGEVTDPAVDVFDREARFIDAVLVPLIQRFPRLRIVFEHVTTRAAVEFVNTAHAGIGATLTPQHLIENRNAIFRGGLRPHYYCLPVLKRESDRQALVAAALSGNPKFFLGTDSAPHARNAKESACGCAGMFTAHAAIELYAEVFDAAGKLGRLEGFASEFGAQFYGRPKNEERITLERREWRAPERIAFGANELVPYRAGQAIAWSLADATVTSRG